MRKFAVAAAVVLLLLAAAVLVAPRVVSLEGLRPRIAAALEEKTGRRVSVAHLSLLLFPGIGVKVEGLSVEGDPGHPQERLLAVPEAEIRLAIVPLLHGRAEFTTVVLRRPAIVFRKYRDGTHSATEIAHRLAKEERGASAPPGAEEKVSVRLRAVRIEDASLSLRVEEEGGRETRVDLSPLSFSLDGIGSRRHDFSLAVRLFGAVRGETSIAGRAVLESGPVVDPARFDLRASGKLFGQRIAVEGKMSAPAAGPPEVDLSVALPEVAVDAIPRIFAAPPRWLSEGRPEGKAAFKGRVSGTLQALSFEIDGDLTRVGWTAAGGIRKFIDAPCTLAVQGHWFPDAWIVSNAEVSLPPLLCVGHGTFTPSSGAHEWSASARIASLAEFARSAGGELAAWAPSGRLTASGEGRKTSTASPARWTAALDLGGVGFRVPGKAYEVSDLSGHVEAGPGSVSFQPLAGLFNGQRFSLRGPVFLNGAPRGRLEVRMAYLDLDALVPRRKEGRGWKAGSPRDEEAKPAGSPGRKSPFAVRAEVRVGAGRFRGMEFRDLSGTVEYERGVLRLDGVRARLFGGEAQLAGRIDLGAPDRAFRLKAAAREIAVGELLERTTSLGPYLSGKGFLEGELAGRGAGFAEFARTAAGRGVVRIAGGKIKGVDLAGTAASLAGLSALVPKGAAAPRGVALPGETAFSELSADFRVDGGKIRTGALRILSQRFGVTGEGTVGFDRVLDFRGVVRIAPGAAGAAGGAAGRFLRGPGGSVEIPVVLWGPLSAPAAAVDAQALARGAAGGLLRGIGERLPGPREEQPGTAPGGKEAPQEPPGRRGFEGLLERILPRR